MRKARTVIFTSPAGLLSHKTCSALFTLSKPLAVPILPCRSSPFATLTMGRRPSCWLPPGASLHTTAILSVGCATPFLTRVSRSTAQQPATTGFATLVPASKKHAGSDEVPHTLLGVAARERLDRMAVPGATTSGLIRRSLVGPRLLKAAIPL